MATNYNLKMAMDAIKSNDKAAILDCGRRFPLTTTLLAKLSKADGIDELLSAIPEHVSVRKIESTLKDGVSEVVEDDDVKEVTEEEIMPEPVKEEKPAKEKKERAPRAKKEKVEKVEEPVVEETVEEEDEYSSMNAVSLYKLCKSRKIKVEPKQDAEVYVKILRAADAATNGNGDDSDDDDDWDI